MSELSNIPRIMQNPALGAVILRSFVDGWEEKRQIEGGVVLPFLFLPIPLVFHEQTAKVLQGTNRSSGLLGFTDKLKSGLLSFHDRVLSFRELSMESFSLSLAKELLRLDPGSGQVYSVPPKLDIMPERVNDLVKASRSLGRLCHSRSLYDVSIYLKVYF